MPRYPFWDGRRELRKEHLNDMARELRRNGKLTVTGAADVYNLGSAGQVLVSRAGSTGSGTPTGVLYAQDTFWARIYVDARDNAPTPLPANAAWPLPWFAEQMLVSVPASATLPAGNGLADDPAGRVGFLEPYMAEFQSLGNLTRYRTTGGIDFSLQGYSGGTFTITVAIAPGGTIGNTHAISWPPTAASIAQALNQLTVPGYSGFTVQADSTTDPLTGRPLLSFFIQGTAQDPGGTPPLLFGGPDVTHLSGTGTRTSGTGTAYLAQGAYLNLLPQGQYALVQELVDGGGHHHYLFLLPYVGFWARIEELPAAGSLLYRFQEVVPTGNWWLNHPQGITGLAREMNGEPQVPPGSVVWLTPLFKAGTGFFYLFEHPNDVRLLRFLGGAQAPNGEVLYPRSADRLGGDDPLAASPTPVQAFMEKPPGAAGTFQVDGYYLGQRAGFCSLGYPRFLAIAEQQPGWSGAISLGSPASATLTVQGGRISNYA